MNEKSSPGRIALRWSGIMSLEQPAAGGESCKTGFFLAEKYCVMSKNEKLNALYEKFSVLSSTP